MQNGKKGAGAPSIGCLGCLLITDGQPLVATERQTTAFPNPGRAFVISGAVYLFADQRVSRWRITDVFCNSCPPSRWKPNLDVGIGTDVEIPIRDVAERGYTVDIIINYGKVQGLITLDAGFASDVCKHQTFPLISGQTLNQSPKPSLHIASIMGFRYFLNPCRSRFSVRGSVIANRYLSFWTICLAFAIR